MQEQRIEELGILLLNMGGAINTMNLVRLKQVGKYEIKDFPC